MNNQYNNIIALSKNLCSANDASLVYLTIFGSTLYGTDTDSSDLDIRGIFLPSIQSVILGKSKTSLHYSTGNDESRNSAADMDIDLWSLQNFILHLLPGGDTSALDVLFSPSNKECVIFDNGLLAPIFANPLKFLDLAHHRAYMQYSLSQAKKYGIKGSRLGAIRCVSQWLQEHETEGRLSAYINDINSACGHEQYCFGKQLPDGEALVLCGKINPGNIRMSEFRDRLKRDMERYGDRAKAAELNEGVDYKALSHALRALDQIEELLRTGKISFPLATRQKLLAVKQGTIPWPTLEGIILNRISEVNALYDCLAHEYSFDHTFAKNYLLGCYGLNNIT